jgi:diguanylate cyclase (GGDEF)-like protein
MTGGGGDKMERRRVLVVDHSKVVRSTLAKHLREHFEVREEADGESAWQTLVLDSSIVAVVSGAQLSRLNGYDLLQRLRGSKLRRLCDIPFLLVVSGNETEADRLVAKNKGVTDFITRGMSRQEVLACVERLGDWALSISLVSAISFDEPVAPKVALPPSSDLLSSAEIHDRLLLAMKSKPDTPRMVSVLKFGLDNPQELTKRFGPEIAQSIAKRIGRLLKDKIGLNESIGRITPFRCLIISPDSSAASCLAFAQRVCRGLANSKVMVGGDAVKIQVSAGIASMPPDNNLSAEQLIALAGKRLERAQQQGGERVVSDDETGAVFDLNERYFIELAKAYRVDGILPQLGSIGLHLMPLLTLIEQEYRFGLPLSELKNRFEAGAKEAMT